MTGFTDTQFREFTEHFTSRARPRGVAADCRVPASYRSAPFFFDAEEVWELQGAELTISPTYPAAQGLVPGSSQGLSLRFPRFLRRRPDKSPEEATTSDAVAAMYRGQSRQVVAPAAAT
jgi:DNA ligase-1